MNKLAESLKNLYASVVSASSNAARRLSAYTRFWSSLTNFFSRLVMRVSKMRRATKMFITLALFLTLFFLWQLMAYNVEQTTFVMCNLGMISLMAFVVCRIMIHYQRESAASEAENDQIVARNRKLELELINLKAELFEIRNTKTRTDIINESGEFVKVFNEARKSAQPGSYQFVLDAINSFYSTSGQGINCGVVYARSADSDTLSLAGSYALACEPERTTIPADGIIGQVISDGSARLLADVPPSFLSALSGLGDSQKVNIFLLPLKSNSQVVAVVEVCSFNKLTLVAMWNEIVDKLDDGIR